MAIQSDYYNTGCPQGDIRLVGGTSSNEGRVEVCYNNAFVPVCDDRWNIEEAQLIACRQLGFHDAYG